MTKRIWLTLLFLTTAAHASDMPLVVSQLVTGASSHVRVTNTASQPVTAWSLAAITTDGAKTHREVYTADGYLSEVTHDLPQSPVLLDRLQPGESRELPLDPLPAGATIEVVALVLDDGTGLGDEQLLSEIFAKRAKERDALRVVVDAFNEVLLTRHGAEAVGALRARFTDLLAREESIPCRAALDAVQTYARSTNPDEIDQSLKTYGTFVTRQDELAVKHSQRRNAATM